MQFDLLLFLLLSMCVEVLEKVHQELKWVEFEVNHSSMWMMWGWDWV